MEAGHSPEMAGAAVAGVLIILYLLFVAAIVILGIIAWWKIFSKAGYSGALSLLMMVPVANLVVFLVLAFGDWPMQKELRLLKKQQEKPGT